jgi:tetratricopeptide (TPR) repeat protein
MNEFPIIKHAFIILCTTSQQLGNFVEAFKLAKEAIDMADHTHESDNIYSAYAEGIMADALYGQGNFKESAEHFKSALKSYERHYRSNSGPEAVELVGAMQLVAWNALSKKDYEEALLACQTALGMTEKLMGPKNADVAACMVNLAIARLHNGDTGEGTEALLLKAFTIYDEIKIQNPEANVVSGPLSTLYTALGDLHNVRGETMMARNSYEKVEKMFQKGKVSAQQARGARKSLLMMDVTSEDADNEDNMRSMIDALERDLDHFKRGK